MVYGTWAALMRGDLSANLVKNGKVWPSSVTGTSLPTTQTE